MAPHLTLGRLDSENSVLEAFNRRVLSVWDGRTLRSVGVSSFLLEIGFARWEADKVWEPMRVEPPEGDTVALCPTLNTYIEIRPKLFSYLP
jgi:hypothetical protein